MQINPCLVILHAATAQNILLSYVEIVKDGLTAGTCRDKPRKIKTSPVNT
jgi:hypothetical protein